MVAAPPGRPVVRDCPECRGIAPGRAYTACKEIEEQEHRERARRGAVKGQRKKEHELHNVLRNPLACEACQEAGIVGQAQYDCAVIVGPYIDCDPRTLDCRDRALAIARQARGQGEQNRQAIEQDERRTRALEDANRPRTCTTTRSRVYPYEVTIVCE